MDFINLKNLQNKNPSQDSLPNNYDIKTKSNEINFVENFELKEYNVEKFNFELNTPTILNSRTLRSEYYSESNFNINDLGRFFKETGTTLTIDYRKNYVRCAAWDFDCLCRIRNVNEHTSESDLMHSLNFIRKNFNNPQISTWVSPKGCGFHIYTDISISYPLHIVLTKSLNVINAYSSKFVIEIPKFMPLPYSAKIPMETYTPYLSDNINFNLLPSKTFYDCLKFEKYDDMSNEKDKIGKISTFECIYHMYYYEKCFETDFVPKFQNIQQIEFGKDCDFFSDFKCYFELNNFKSAKKVEVYSEDTILNEFITDYNESFSGDNVKDINWRRFIEHATNAYGSLYLQHLIVLCHKYILKNDFHYDLNVFKKQLVKIFSKSNVSRDVLQFLERYDMYTYNNYASEQYEDMKDYFQLIFKLGLTDPNKSQADILEKCLDQLCGFPIRQTINSINIKEFEKNQDKLNKILDKYISCMGMFKFVIKHESVWYFLNSDFYYKLCGQGYNFPGINEWCCLKNQIKTYCVQYIRNNMPNIKNFWTDASIIIPTSVGNFNSVTGTYSIRCPFLRYTISRNRMIWKDSEKSKMYKEQNKDVVEVSASLDHYASNMSEYMTKMFIHYSLVPSILDLENHSYIDGNMFYKFIDKIVGFEDLKDAHFIVEYIPMNVEFVHFVMCLMQEYDDHNILCNYKALTRQHFSFSYTESLEGWKSIFNEYNKTLKFNANEKSQTETLKSIESKHVVKPDERFCFLASIIAYCMCKCSEFNLIKKACNVHILKKIPEALNENYPDKQYTTSLKDAQHNMKRAKKIVFGTNLDGLNTNIINMICMVFTSCSFVLENVLEFFNVLSSNCTINSSRKKFLLFKGAPDSGKSKWCELFVSMNEPESASIKNLAEAISRSNVTQFYNLVSISEVKCEYDYMIKSITGSDKDSGKTFYTQDLTKSKTQAIVIGATNVNISFIKKRDEIIDRVSCERIHAVLMDGRHEADCHDTFAKMFVENRYYRVEEENSSLTSYVFSALWLSYIWYNKYKDDMNLYPINLNNKNVKEYQENIYRKNNKIYDTICRLGLREEKDMYMESYRIKDLLKKNLNDKEYYDFLNDFNNYYQDLFKNKIINNLIESEFYDHVVANFEVCEELGAHITTSELIDRSDIYEDQTQKSNALSYFSQKNVKFFNKDTQEYTNIKFKQKQEHYKLNSLNSNNYSEIGLVESLIK